MELKQYWNIVKKRMWMILLLVAVSGAATGLYSYYFLDKQYEASAKMIVNQTRDLSELNGRLDIGTINSNIQLVKTYKEIIKTPRIMDKVAKEYPGIGLTADQLSSKVSVSSVNDTQVMSVTAKDLSYQQAAKIVNSVAKVFENEIPSLMKVDNVNILNEADLEAKPAPVSPKPNMNIAISIVLSLMIGLGIAFLLDYLDDTIKSEDDIGQILGLSTLTLIPKMKERDIAAVRQKIEETKAVRGEKNATLDT